MEVCGYPRLEEHCARHRELTAQVNDLADTWRNERNPEILHHLREFLREWLTHHIAEVDRDIAQYTKGKKQDIQKALKNLR